MAYDPDHRTIVLFGGSVGSTRTNDTWVWDGTAWEQIFGASPPATLAPTATSDPVRGGVVMQLWERSEPETWFFDGSDWRRLMIGAAMGHPASLAFDALRQRVVASDGSSTYLGRAADPAIAVEPKGVTANRFGSITLHSQGCGQSPLMYQWLRNGKPLEDDERISGSRETTLRIDPVHLSDSGHYAMRVSSALGSHVSRAAKVTITVCYPDCDTSTGVNVLDIFDILCFGNLFAIGDPYACDCEDTGPAPCDVFDFLCFGNYFARGCP